MRGNSNNDLQLGPQSLIAKIPSDWWRCRKCKCCKPIIVLGGIAYLLVRKFSQRHDSRALVR
jgi:hypothetical protein